MTDPSYRETPEARVTCDLNDTPHALDASFRPGQNPAPAPEPSAAPLPDWMPTPGELDDLERLWWTKPDADKVRLLRAVRWLLEEREAR